MCCFDVSADVQVLLARIDRRINLLAFAPPESVSTDVAVTFAVCDGGQDDAVLQHVLFGPVVHGSADGQEGARLLLLQQVCSCA